MSSWFTQRCQDGEPFGIVFQPYWENGERLGHVIWWADNHDNELWKKLMSHDAIHGSIVAAYRQRSLRRATVTKSFDVAFNQAVIVMTDYFKEKYRYSYKEAYQKGDDGPLVGLLFFQEEKK